jgi:hypothetical protein
MSTVTLQTILQQFWTSAFPTLSFLPSATRKVVNALIMCRTEWLGAHRYTCDAPECAANTWVHNSCGNRHCPQCQALARARWVRQRLGDLLPVHYFHIVFTLPQELRPIVRANMRICYRLLFKAASETIVTLAADKKRLGGSAGLILMLHTWTGRLTFHPHLHGLVPGGVLSADRKRWIASPEKFFLPVGVVAAMFKGKYMAFLKDAYNKGLINVQPACFSKVVKQVYELKWHVYLESTLKSPIYVVKYLGAYANRVAIANTRIVAAKNGIVRFSYYDRKSKSTRMEKLDAVTFIQRFVQHILPQGLVKIRYYGILANRVRDNVLPICRDLLEKELPHLAKWLRITVAGELLKVVAAPKGRLCPVCNAGHLQITGWNDGLVKRVGANRGSD